MTMSTREAQTFGAKRLIRWLMLSLIISCCTFTSSVAQGFSSTNVQTDVDTLLESKVEFSKEAFYLFHYLTKYQFYELDEVNEFQKAKQMKQIEAVTEGIRAGWKSRYKITFDGRRSIQTDPRYGTWLLLSSYDFQKNAFQVSFQDFALEEIRGINSQKLDSFLKGKVPTTAASARTFAALKLDPFQKKSYPLRYKPDVAESFKSYVENQRIACDVLLDIVGDPTFSTETIETDGFRQFKEHELDEFKKSVGFVNTFDDDGIRRRKPHPFNNLSVQQRDKEIAKLFRSQYPDAETHYVLYNLNLACKIQAIRFLADKEKIFEWRPK